MGSGMEEPGREQKVKRVGSVASPKKRKTIAYRKQLSKLLNTTDIKDTDLIWLLGKK